MNAGLKPISPPDDGSRLWAEFPGDWLRPDAPESYQLFWRARDGYGQIVPRPEPGDVAKFYPCGDYYTHGSGDGWAGGTLSLANRIILHLAWRCDHGVEATPDWWEAMLQPGPKRVLEIGCGDGTTLRMLSGLGHACTGVEPDSKGREVAQKGGIEILPGTAEDLPDAVRTRKYDCVLMLHVLEHCIDPERALENARDLLEEGGTLIVEVPNNHCAGRDFFGIAWLWLDVPRHLNFFTRASLTALLESLGFRSLRFEYCGYTRQFSEGWFKQQDHVGAALGLPPRSGTLSRLRYLVASGFGADDRKYDSIRVVASQPAHTA